MVKEIDQMTNNNNNFKLTSADWQGYVRRALEDIEKDVGGIKKGVDNLNKQMIKVKVKVAGIGAGVSLITTILIFLIRELLAK